MQNVSFIHHLCFIRYKLKQAQKKCCILICLACIAVSCLVCIVVSCLVCYC